MTCYYPLKGYRGKDLTKNGKHKLVFKVNEAMSSSHLHHIEVPCGYCVGCRLERSRQWAVRLVHENNLHEDSCYLTLTYSDENLPKGGTLVKSDFQKFMKRLRSKLDYNNSSGSKIRFFHCGEYGEELGRPHYHAIIFGYHPSDKKFHTWSGDHRLYVSKFIDEVWGLGHCYVGDVTFHSCAYVARYIMKKIYGDKADEHYTTFDINTAEVFKKVPEYVTMSRRPGIGRDWYDKYKHDWFKNDYLIMNGVKMKPAKFYELIYEKQYPWVLNEIKDKRKRDAIKRKDDNTWERLAVKEVVKKAALNLLPRNKNND